MERSDGHLGSRPVRRSGTAAQFGWVSAGNISASALQALTLVLLARWSGPESFGLLSSILAIIYILQTVTDVGIPVYIIRTRAASPDSARIGQALRLNVWSALALGLISLALIVFAATFIDGSYIALLPLALWSPAERNTDIWLGIFVADGHAQASSIAIFVRRVALAVLFVGLYFVGVSPVGAYCWASCLVAVIANIWARRLLRARVYGLSGEPARRSILSEARPYWINSIAVHGRNIDVLLVGIMAGGLQAGYYAAASRTTGPLRIFPSALAAVLVPAAARGADLRGLLRLAGYLLAVLCGGYTLIVVFAPFAVRMALGDQFEGAVAPVQIVVSGLILSAAASMGGSLLQGLGSARTAAVAAVISSSVGIVGVAIGSAVAGAVGASWALLASFGVQAVIVLAAIRKKVRGRESVEEDVGQGAQ